MLVGRWDRAGAGIVLEKCRANSPRQPFSTAVRVREMGWGMHHNGGTQSFRVLGIKKVP